MQVEQTPITSAKIQLDDDPDDDLFTLPELRSANSRDHTEEVRGEPTLEAIRARYDWLKKFMNEGSLSLRPTHEKLKHKKFEWVYVSENLKKHNFQYPPGGGRTKLESSPTDILRLIYEEEGIECPLTINGWKMTEVHIPKRMDDVEKVWMNLNVALPSKFRSNRTIKPKPRVTDAKCETAKSDTKSAPEVTRKRKRLDTVKEKIKEKINGRSEKKVKESPKDETQILSPASESPAVRKLSISKVTQYVKNSGEKSSIPSKLLHSSLCDSLKIGIIHNILHMNADQIMEVIRPINKIREEVKLSPLTIRSETKNTLKEKTPKETSKEKTPKETSKDKTPKDKSTQKSTPKRSTPKKNTPKKSTPKSKSPNDKTKDSESPVV